MALVMAEMPDVWQRVLAEHVPDQGGRCRECRDAMGSKASWPCQTRKVAEEAKWVYEGGLPSGREKVQIPQQGSEAPPEAPRVEVGHRPAYGADAFGRAPMGPAQGRHLRMG